MENSIDEIVFKAVKDLSGLGYVYPFQFKGAVMYQNTKHGNRLTDEEIEEATEKVYKTFVEVWNNRLELI